MLSQMKNNKFQIPNISNTPIIESSEQKINESDAKENRTTEYDKRLDI